MPSDLTIGYSIGAVLWLSVVSAGIRNLVKNRSYSVVARRDVWLSVISILSMCAVIIIGFSTAPLGDNMSCSLEFWIISLFVPLSVITTQLKVARLCYLSWSYQVSYQPVLSRSRTREEKLDTWLQRTTDWFGEIIEQQRQIRPQELRAYFSKICGALILFHTILTFIVYSADSSFSARKTASACFLGWEWYPIYVTYILYMYMIGPILVLMTFKIKDTHNMKIELWINNLAATIMLPPLISSFVNGPFASYLNGQFPSIMWITPIMMTQTLTAILIPSYEVYKVKKASDRALAGKSVVIWQGIGISQEFLRILKSSESFKKFFEYTKHDYSTENPIFIKRVLGWLQLVSSHINTHHTEVLDETLIKKARDIYEESFSINEVNVNYTTTLAIRTAFQNNTINADVFNKAFKEIVYLVESDTLVRYNKRTAQPTTTSRKTGVKNESSDPGASISSRMKSSFIREPETMSTSH